MQPGAMAGSRCARHRYMTHSKHSSSGGICSARYRSSSLSVSATIISKASATPTPITCGSASEDGHSAARACTRAPEAVSASLASHDEYGEGTRAT